MSQPVCPSCNSRHDSAERVRRVTTLFLTTIQTGEIDAEIVDQVGESQFTAEDLCDRCLVAWMADAAAHVN